MPHLTGSLLSSSCCPPLPPTWAGPWSAAYGALVSPDPAQPSLMPVPVGTQNIYRRQRATSQGLLTGPSPGLSPTELSFLPFTSQTSTPNPHGGPSAPPCAHGALFPAPRVLTLAVSVPRQLHSQSLSRSGETSLTVSQSLAPQDVQEAPASPARFLHLPLPCPPLAWGHGGTLGPCCQVPLPTDCAHCPGWSPSTLHLYGHLCLHSFHRRHC